MTFLVTEPETLNVYLTTRFDGTAYSFSSRDEDPGRVPYAISWGTQNPGGFADASVTLARPPWPGALETPMFGGITIKSASGEVKFHGRVRGTPQIDSEAVTLNAEGLAAHLDDNTFFRFLGCHNDLNAWTEPTNERQLFLIGTGVSPTNDGGVINADTGTPVLDTRLTSPSDEWQGSERWLRVDGIPIGRIKGSWSKFDFVDELKLGWDWRAILSPDGTIAGDLTGNMVGSGPGTYDVSAGGARYYAGVSLIFYDALPSTDGLIFDLQWVPTVVGTHGLTLQNLDDGSGRWGISIGDALEYCITDGAPEIDIFSIEDADYVLSHLVHTGTVRELVEQVSAFGSVNGRVPDWGVYENGFFWGAPGSFGRTWRVNRSQMAVATAEGPDAEQMTQGVVITYTDGSGRSLSVGPPGIGADVETALLASTDPNNRAPAYSIIVRDAGLTTTGGAILVGQALLAETNSRPHKGTVTITGDLEDDAGNIGHASEVRACDRVIVVNDEEPTEQDIVSTNYDHDSLTVTANVGTVPGNIETLLARLAAAVQGL
jgi:hypothetical protein